MKKSKVKYLTRVISLILVIMINTMVLKSQPAEETKDLIKLALTEELTPTGIEIGNSEYYLYLCNSENSEGLLACLVPIESKVYNAGNNRYQLAEEDVEEDIELEEWMIEPKNWLHTKDVNEQKLSKGY